MRAKTIFASRTETNETSDISVHMQRATLRCREPKYRASHTVAQFHISGTNYQPFKYAKYIEQRELARGWI